MLINPDTACAIIVAIATPLIPKLNFITKSKSKTMLIIEAMIKKYKGLLESPIDLSREVDKLYIYVKINPSKIIIKYSFESLISSKGILNNKRIESMKYKESTIKKIVVHPMKISDKNAVSLNLSKSLDP